MARDTALKRRRLGQRARGAAVPRSQWSKLAPQLPPRPALPTYVPQPLRLERRRRGQLAQRSKGVKGRGWKQGAEAGGLAGSRLPQSALEERIAATRVAAAARVEAHRAQAELKRKAHEAALAEDEAAELAAAVAEQAALDALEAQMVGRGPAGLRGGAASNSGGEQPRNRCCDRLAGVRGRTLRHRGWFEASGLLPRGPSCRHHENGQELGR